MTTVSLTGGAFKFSPGYWYGPSNTRAITSSFAQTWCEGSWFDFYWTASSSPTLTFGLSGSGCTIDYSLNGGSIVRGASLSTSFSGIIASSPNYIRVYFGYNGGSFQHLSITGATVDSGSTGGTAPGSQPWIITQGDSQTETYIVPYTQSWGYIVSQQNTGYDWSNQSAGGSGWVSSGAGGLPGLYPLSGQGRWNIIDDTGAVVSILDSNNKMSAYGGTGQAPAAVIVVLGINDALKGASTSNVTSSVTQWAAACRAATSVACKLVVIINFNIYNSNITGGTAMATAIKAGVSAANSAGSNVHLIDLGPATATYLANNSMLEPDNIHLNASGNSYVAGLIQPQLANILGGNVATWQTPASNTTWTATSVNAAAILSRIEGMMPWLANNIAGSGAATSPYGNGSSVNASADFALGAFVCAAAGNNTWLSTGITAMSYACANVGSDGNFTMLPAWLAWGVANANSLAGTTSHLSTWQSQLTNFYVPPYNNNWAAYSAAGAWAAINVGGITSGQSVPVHGNSGGGSTMTAVQFIEYLWTSSQTAQNQRMTNSAGLYDDQSPVPLSLSTEYAGRLPWSYVALTGYNGASAATIRTQCLLGGQTSLQINSPSGSVPNSGRTSDHVWVDAAAQSTAMLNAIYYAGSSQTQQAQMFQRMANVGFVSDAVWQRTGGTDPNGHSLSGTFGITKNQFNPSSRIGFQHASDQLFYNCGNVLSWSILYQLESAHSSIGEAPFPGEVGGYVNILPSRWQQTMANAGGIFVQIGCGDNGVAPSSNYDQAWSVLGVTRINRSLGWDERLGPADGYIANGSSIQGSAFGPAWNSNGTWTEIAKMTGFSANGGPGGNYNPVVTSQLTTPMLTKLTIKWNGLSGQPTHTQLLTICPDGILSQITSTVAAGSFGHALPLFHDNGATNATQSIGSSILSTSYGGASTQSFIVLGSNPTLTSSETTLTSYGNLSTYRAVVNAAESAVFVYPQSTATSDPSASSVQSSFVYTSGSQNFSSSLGWVNGSLYRGRFHAGGYGTQIGPQPGGTPDAVFNTACKFILTLNGSGVITNVETDTTTNATINGHPMSLTAFTPASVSAPSGGGQTLTGTNPGSPVQNQNFTVTLTFGNAVSNLNNIQYNNGSGYLPSTPGGILISATLTNSTTAAYVFNIATVGAYTLTFHDTSSGATSGTINYNIVSSSSGGDTAWVPSSPGRGLPRYNPGWYGTWKQPLANTDWAANTGLPPPGIFNVYSAFNYTPPSGPGSYVGQGIVNGMIGHFQQILSGAWTKPPPVGSAIPFIGFALAPGGLNGPPIVNADFRLQDVPTGIADTAWQQMVAYPASLGYPVVWYRPGYEAGYGNTTPSNFKGQYNWNGTKGNIVPPAQWHTQWLAAWNHIVTVMRAQAVKSGITIRIFFDTVILNTSQDLVNSAVSLYCPAANMADGASMDQYIGNGYWDWQENYPNYGYTNARNTSPFALNATQVASGLNDMTATWAQKCLWIVDNNSSIVPTLGNPHATYDNASHGLSFPDQATGAPNGKQGTSVVDLLNATSFKNGWPFVHGESGMFHGTAPGKGSGVVSYNISTPPISSRNGDSAGNDLNFWPNYIKPLIAFVEAAGVKHLGFSAWDGSNGTVMSRISYGANPGAFSTLSTFLQPLSGGTTVSKTLSINPIGNVTVNTAVNVTVIAAGYTPVITNLQVNFGSGYGPLPGAPTQTGNQIIFSFTPVTTGTFTIQVEDTSQSPTVTSGQTTYIVGAAANTNTITIPSTIEQQSQGLIFHWQAAFNYVPIQANVVWYDVAGLQGQVALPSGSVWSDNGQVVTIPTTDNYQGAHTFNIGDTTFSPVLVSNTLNFNVGPAGSGGGGTYTVPTPPPVTTTPSLTVSAPTAMQEASVGAGVTENITITANNYTGTTVYWYTYDSSNTQQSGPFTATLVNNQITVNVFFAANGYYVQAQNLTTSPTVVGKSSQITITDPTTSSIVISGPAPGTQTASVAGGSVTLPLAITTQNDTNPNVYAAVFQSNGTIRGSYAPFALDANGNTTATLTFITSGDYYQVVDQVSSPTFTFKSSAITIINPNTQASFSITPPGTQYLSGGATSVTVPMIINTTGYTGAVVYWEVLSISGSVLTPFTAATLVNGHVTINANFTASGQVVKVVDNPTTITVTQTSSPVTVLPQQTGSQTINVGSPGLQTTSSPGGSVQVTVPIQTTGLTGQIYYGVYTSGGTLEGSLQNLWLTADGSTPTIRVPTTITGVKSGQSFTVQVAFNYVPVQANVQVMANSQQTFGPITSGVWDSTGQLLTFTVLNNNQATHYLQVEDTTASLPNSPLVSAQTVYTPGATGTGTAFTVTPFPSVATTLSAGIPVTVTMLNTGDVIKAQNATSNPTVVGQSSPVTITYSGDSTPTITVSAPGTVQGSVVGTPVLVNETVVTNNISAGTTLYWQVLTQGGVGEQTLTAFSVDPSFTTVIQNVPFLNTGDVFQVVNATSSPSITATSSPITINIPNPPPTASITVTGPATIQATAGLGANVTFAITGANLASNIVYYETLTSNGSVETAYQQLELTPSQTNNSASAQVQVFLQASGDLLQVVDTIPTPTIVAQSAPVNITPQQILPAIITVAQPSPFYVGLQTFTLTISASGSQPGQVYGFVGVSPPTSITQTGVAQFVLNTGVSPTTGTAQILVTNPGPVQSFWVSVDGQNWSANWSAAAQSQSSTTATLNTVSLPVMPSMVLQLSGTITSSTATLKVCLRVATGAQPQQSDPDVVNAVVTAATPPATGGLWTATVTTGGAGIGEKLWYSINGQPFQTPFPGAPALITPQTAVFAWNPGPQVDGVPFRAVADLNYPLNSLSTIQFSITTSPTPTWVNATTSNAQVSGNPGSPGNSRVYFTITDNTVATPTYFQVQDLSAPGASAPVVSNVQQFSVVAAAGGGSPAITAYNPGPQQTAITFSAIAYFNYVVSNINTIYFSNSTGSSNYLPATSAFGGATLGTQANGDSIITIKIQNASANPDYVFSVRDTAAPGNTTVTSNSVTYATTIAPPAPPAGTVELKINLSNGAVIDQIYPAGTTITSQSGLLPP